MSLLSSIIALNAGPLLTAPRSPKWAELEHEHLEREGWCRFCGGYRDLQVHHVLPFHLFPEHELDPKNLITLCMDPSRECHLRMGHLGNWSKYNPKIRSQAKADPSLNPRLARMAVNAWGFSAFVDGPDLVMMDVRGTCFGGDSDPQDNGITAIGFDTRKNPNSPIISLPMRGQMFSGLSAAEHAALDDSPVPRISWLSVVDVAQWNHAWEGRAWSDIKSSISEWETFAVAELGPGRRTGNAFDLSRAAAQKFDPKASATNFAMQGIVRIRGGAHFLPS